MLRLLLNDPVVKVLALGKPRRGITQHDCRYQKSHKTSHDHRLSQSHEASNANWRDVYGAMPHMHKRPAATTRRVQRSSRRKLALTSLKARVGFVDNINPALTAHQTVRAVTAFKRLKRIFDFHQIDPCMRPNNACFSVWPSKKYAPDRARRNLWAWFSAWLTYVKRRFPNNTRLFHGSHCIYDQVVVSFTASIDTYVEVCATLGSAETVSPRSSR